MAQRGVLDLDNSDLDLVLPILQQYVPGETVYVFGSRATGKTRFLSDLDLVLDRTEPLDPQVMRERSEAFDQSDLPIRVDVVDLATVTETFRRRVLAERIPFPMTPERESERHEVSA
jgi:predicted nucleotidyltransferase